MVVGDPDYWVRRFTSIDKRLLVRIIALWPKCLEVLPASPEEDKITINLRSLLTRDPEARRIFYYLEYQFEPQGFTPDGLAFSKGKIDLAVLLDQGCTRYLAYECKRLNVHHKGARQSLATLYVNEGVERFITEQYAEGLPVGCMLGYVLDGDIDFARSSVYTAINTNKNAIGLIGGPVSVPSIADIERFTTEHTRPTTASVFHIHHSFLPFPKRKSNNKKKQSN
ncbi:hypothetical protein [Nitrospina watsonii]|uniref:Restriction endonuclease type IV Mrr domain-containing protein n=1 Tax=Nitrospina watsonii TaxID=1323948 RepID=A0ABM9HBH8_9BACT|nr:hypothetical protein [Nitrospina watsonii]CAI2717511.1 conserved protein of unknown function [Nitrospina watsonii]